MSSVLPIRSRFCLTRASACGSGKRAPCEPRPRPLVRCLVHAAGKMREGTGITGPSRSAGGSRSLEDDKPSMRLFYFEATPIVPPATTTVRPSRLFSRRAEDDQLGQGDWGEQWWLPAEQSEFVRAKLKQTHAELIEQSSDYEDAVSFGLSHYIRTVVQAIPVPSRDPRPQICGRTQRPPRKGLCLGRGFTGCSLSATARGCTIS